MFNSIHRVVMGHFEAELVNFKVNFSSNLVTLNHYPSTLSEVLGCLLLSNIDIIFALPTLKERGIKGVRWPEKKGKGAISPST